MTELPRLPEPRTPGRYSIALVCLGNICRSPMADVVLNQRIDDAGLAGRVTVVSSGTGDWHVGQPMDSRAAATLTAGGYDASQHRAQQWATAWLAEHDLVLAMDSSNHHDILETVAGAEAAEHDRVRMFRDFDPVGLGDVPDPYYGGDDGFDEVLTMVERTSAAIVDALDRLLG